MNEWKKGGDQCKIKLSLLGGYGLGSGGVNKYNSTLDGVVYFINRQITN